MLKAPKTTNISAKYLDEVMVLRLSSHYKILLSLYCGFSFCGIHKSHMRFDKSSAGRKEKIL